MARLPRLKPGRESAPQLDVVLVGPLLDVELQVGRVRPAVALGDGPGPRAAAQRGAPGTRGEISRAAPWGRPASMPGGCGDEAIVGSQLFRGGVGWNREPGPMLDVVQEIAKPGCSGSTAGPVTS